MSTRKESQRGVALVEFVIVAPLLVLMLFAAAELGRAFYQYNTLTKCVRDGARHAASNALFGGLDLVLLQGGLISETRNLVVYGNTAGSGEMLLPDWSTAEISVQSAGTQHVRVTGTYTYRPMVLNALPTFGFGDGSIPLTFQMGAVVTMRAT